MWDIQRAKDISFYESVIRYARERRRRDSSVLDMDEIEETLSESLHTGTPSPDSDDDVHMSNEEALYSSGADSYSSCSTCSSCSSDDDAPYEYRTRRVIWRVEDVYDTNFPLATHKRRVSLADVSVKSLMSAPLEGTFALDVCVVRGIWRALNCVELTDQYPVAQRVVGAPYRCAGMPADNGRDIRDVPAIATLRSWIELHGNVFLDHRSVPRYNSAVVTWMRAGCRKRESQRIPITPRDITRMYDVDGAPVYVFAFGEALNIYHRRDPNKLKCVLPSKNVLRVSHDYGALVCRLPRDCSTVVIAMRSVRVPRVAGVPDTGVPSYQTPNKPVLGTYFTELIRKY